MRKKKALNTERSQSAVCFQVVISSINQQRSISEFHLSVPWTFECICSIISGSQTQLSFRPSGSLHERIYCPLMFKKKQRRWTQLRDFCGAEANKYGVTFEIMQMLESVTAAIIVNKNHFSICSLLQSGYELAFFSASSSLWPIGLTAPLLQL